MRRAVAENATADKEASPNTIPLHIRFMTANIGSMTGKSREIADIMHIRKMMIACVQETKWKDSKAKEIGKVSYSTTMAYAEA